MPDTLRDRLKERLDTLGIFAREASRRAGFSLGYVGDILDGRSKSPEMSRLIKLAEVLDCDVAYLIGTQDRPKKVGEVRSFTPRGEPRGAGDSLVPLYGAKGFGAGAWFSLDERPAAKVSSLPQLAHVKGAYAVSVPNEMMAPRYGVGEIAYVNPALTPREGDYVFAKARDGSASIGRIKAITDSAMVLEYLKAGARTHEVPFDELASAHRIVGSVTPA